MGPMGFHINGVGSLAGSIIRVTQAPTASPKNGVSCILKDESWSCGLKLYVSPYTEIQ
jgi:hypothetical protein